MSVFEFNANTPAKRNQLPLAKNALRKLRTIRHPDVLKFLDGVETETTVHIMTERVRPLSVALQDAGSKTAQEREDWILWGLHRVSVRAIRCVLDAKTCPDPNVTDRASLYQRFGLVDPRERMYQLNIYCAIRGMETGWLRGVE